MKSLSFPPNTRAALLYNPVARTLARHGELIPRVVNALAKQKIDCQVVPTIAQGSASEQVREQIAAGCRLIIAAGGDGTVNEVADGMLYTGVPLAVIPGGTANVLARELQLPLHLEKAAAAISSLEPRTVTVGTMRNATLSHRSFLCMMGVGLDADIISRLNLDFKAAAGKLAYYICGFSQVARLLPEFEVLADGRPFRASFALVSRVRNYGGDLEIARGASLLRDDFEVVLFRGNLAVQYLPYLLGVALKKIHRMPGVTVLRASSVSCHPLSDRKIYAQVDGELVSEVPVHAEVLSGALTLLVPPAFARREETVIATDIPACV